MKHGRRWLSLNPLDLLVVMTHSQDSPVRYSYHLIFCRISLLIFLLLQAYSAGGAAVAGGGGGGGSQCNCGASASNCPAGPPGPPGTPGEKGRTFPIAPTFFCMLY